MTSEWRSGWVFLNATVGVTNPGNGGGTIPKGRQNDCR